MKETLFSLMGLVLGIILANILRYKRCNHIFSKWEDYGVINQQRYCAKCNIKECR